jgi:diguanylate cyclase (GGDEF)-like protein
MKNIILTIVEFLLFTSLIFFTITGKVSSISQVIPYSYLFASILLILILGIYCLAFFQNPSNRVPLIAAFGIAAFTFTIQHFSIPADLSEMATIPVIYLVVILVSSFIGKFYAWIPSVALFSLGEFLFFTVSTFNGDANAWTSGMAGYIKSNILNFFYLISAGVIPSLLSLRLSETMENNRGMHVSGTRTEKPSNEKTRIANSATDIIVLPPDTGSISTKTLVLQGDQTGEIKIGNQGVDELLASVVYFMKRNFKSYSALGFIYDAQKQSFVLNSFQSKSINVKKDTIIPLGDGVIGKIGTEKRIFMSGDLSYYNSGLNYYIVPIEITSLLAVPVISEREELLGALVLDSQDKNAFREQDKDILKRFSSLAAALITNARMRIYQERAARTFQIFYEASHQLTTTINVMNVFDVLFQMSPSTVACTRQMGILFDENATVGTVRKLAGNSSDIKEGFQFPINAGLYSFAFKKRRPVNINDFALYQSKYYRFYQDEPHDKNIRSLLIFPLLDDEFRCQGLYSLESDQPNVFSGEAEQILTTLVENASVAFTRAMLYAKMEKLATTDGLTGLNNHRHFQELLSREMERTKRYGNLVSLLLMDIDHFKSFNDTYGHPVGDLVLKEISACIQKSIRLNDIPARYGGEEFTVIIPEANEVGAAKIAERIRQTIENHIIYSLDRQLRVTVSIGVSSAPGIAKTQQELIDSADKALYYSKETGRNRVSIFAAGMSGKDKK